MSVSTAATIDPKAGSDFVLHGALPRDGAGFAMARGDFDGDGIDDLAISVPGALSDPEAGVRGGVVYLMFGGADFVARWADGFGSESPRVVVSGAKLQLGMLAAGDLDGDGRDDLLIGEPWATEGDSARHEGGAAYLIYGRERDAFAGGITVPAGADVAFVSPERSVHLGEWLAFGDFDGSGPADVAIGAMYANGPDGVRPHAGAAYVYLGRARKKIPARIDLGRKPDLAIHGAERDDTAGRSLVFADWNGDAKADLLVGAYYGDGPKNDRRDPGDAHVVLGRASGKMKGKVIDLAAAAASATIYGVGDLGAFSRVTTAGDFDGDGLGDFAASAYRAPEAGDRALSGTVDIVFGRANPPAAIDLATTCEARILGGAPWDHTGRCLKAGDLNGDGKDDLLVGVPFGDPLGADGLLRNQAGFVGVLMGRARSDFADTLDLAAGGAFDHVIEGVDANDQLPFAMEVLDIDGDGRQDVVLSAPFAAGRANERPQSGDVYFLLGASRSWSVSP